MTAYDEETGDLRCDDCGSTSACKPECSHVAPTEPPIADDVVFQATHDGAVLDAILGGACR